MMSKEKLFKVYLVCDWSAGDCAGRLLTEEGEELGYHY